MGSLVIGIGAVGASAVLLACLLRFGSVVPFFLAAYLLAWLEVVAVVLVLSAGGFVTEVNLLAAFVSVSIATLAAWTLSGRPRPPSFGLAARRAAGAAADPLVAIPLTISVIALCYTLVVTLTTAPNDGDPLAYELTRAAFWRQEHGVVNLDAAYVPLDFWPPVAETMSLVIMTLSDSDRLTGIPQWLAVVMLALGTYGVGRRVSLGRAAALWGASLVPLFPVVITQSWSAFTDIVFASFAVAAVYFGLGSRREDLVLLSVATGLAMGTKFLGPILAPLFILILALGQPVRRWIPVLLAALAGAFLASLWYVRTLVETGDPVGNGGAGIQSRELAPVVTTFQLLTAEIFDLSGAGGRNVWLYPLTAGFLLAAWLVGRTVRRKAIGTSLVVAAALVGLAPFAVSLVGRVYARSGLWLGEVLGRRDLVDQLHDWRPSEVSDGAYSWFGPVGTVLVLGALFVSIFEIRRNRLPPVAFALAAAPLLGVVLISIAVSYQNHQGRYVMSAFALCIATLGGFALRQRWAGMAIAGVAGVTVVLSLANSLGKPTGVGMLNPGSGRSVWSMPRWEQQGILRSTPVERDEVATFRFVDESVPEDAAVGVALAYNSFVFPYFGSTLDRKLSIVDAGETAPADVDWIVASPAQSIRGCPGAWRRVRHGPYGWSVWRRTTADRCSQPRVLTSS
jgi:hypothetical protein